MYWIIFPFAVDKGHCSFLSSKVLYRLKISFLWTCGEPFLRWFYGPFVWYMSFVCLQGMNISMYCIIFPFAVFFCTTVLYRLKTSFLWHSWLRVQVLVAPVILWVAFLLVVLRAVCLVHVICKSMFAMNEH